MIPQQFAAEADRLLGLIKAQLREYLEARGYSITFPTSGPNAGGFETDAPLSVISDALDVPLEDRAGLFEDLAAMGGMTA